MSKNTGASVVIQKRYVVIAAVIALLLIACGIVIGLNWQSWFGAQDDPPTSQTVTPDIDPDAQDWTGQQPENAGGESSGIKIPGYPSITLPADTETVSVALLNPEGNPCYFTFEIALNDTGEVLYTSKLVPPGQAIYEITLSRPLTAGEYNAVIRISTTSLADGSAMNGANVETVLVVQ
ncbi:MAG: hypothetical protein KHW62_00320 [Clostridiales bacterium]|nr:hypothetical protein [Clostridiales bacterium]